MNEQDMEKVNGGLVIEPRSPQGWVFGATTGVTKRVRHAVPWLVNPVFSQVWRDRLGQIADTYGCVTNSEANPVEAIMDALFPTMSHDAQKFFIDNGYIIDGHFRISRRIVAKLSGTVPRVGNSLQKVAETVRAYWPDAYMLVPEHVWPWIEGMTEDEYYADVPQETIAKAHELGRKVKELLEYNYEWINPDDTSVDDVLPYGLVQACVLTGWKGSDGFWHRGVGQSNHAVAKYGSEGKIDLIEDSYRFDGKLTRKYAADFALEWSMLHSLNLRETATKPMLERYNFKDGQLVAVRTNNAIIPCVYAAKLLRLLDTAFEGYFAGVGRQENTPIITIDAEEGMEIHDFKGNLVRKFSFGNMVVAGTASFGAGEVTPSVGFWAGLSVENKKRIVSFTRVFLSTFLALAGAQRSLGFPASWSAFGSLMVACISAAFKEGIDYLIKK